jgi:hypothetical protein
LVFGQDLKQIVKNKKASTSTISGINTLPKDTSKIESKALVSDTTRKDTTTKTTKPQRDIETTIEYSAEDSIVLDATGKTAFLYKDSKLNYGTRNITANTIDMDYNSNTITAKYGEDTTGKKLGVPIFKEGKDQYEAKVIKYNYKTKKGQVKGIVTKQGDGVVHGEVVKKQPNNTMFVEHAEYSTCDLREPHFCIKAQRIKFVAGKKIVTKAFNMQLDDIPTPLAFVFGIFPMTKKRASGIIIPSYVDNATRGLGILGGGFYWAVNPYLGARITVDAYTNGGTVWNFNTDYRSRYSFQGNMNFNYSDIYLARDNPSNQQQSKSVWIRWTHSTLSKGTGRFSASVNMGSSGFNNNTQLDPVVRNTGSFQSNVSYSNEIKKTPFNYAISFRQSQSVARNTASSGRMDISFPEASINMKQIYPLRNIPFIGKAEPIKKFNFRVSSTISNTYTNILSPYEPGFAVNGLIMPVRANYRGRPDSASQFILDSTDKAIEIKNFRKIDTINFSNSNFSEQARRAGKLLITNSIPIGTSIRFFKYFNLNPSINLTQRIYDRQFNFTDWDSTSKTAGSNVQFDKYNQAIDANASASVTTRIYGTFFIKRLNIEAIRHTLNPSVGVSYLPTLEKYNKEFVEVQINNGTVLGVDKIWMNKFTGARGTPRINDQANLNFGLVNQFEMKVRDRKDTTKIAYKKIMLLDNLSMNGSYNLVADSFNLSIFPITARTRVGPFDINFTSNLDPYYYQDVTPTTFASDARRVKRRTSFYDFGGASNTKFETENQKNGTLNNSFKGIGQITNMSIAISTSFKPKKDAKGKKIAAVADGTDYFFMASRGLVPYVDWLLPWSLNIAYNMTYVKFSGSPIVGTVLDKSVFTNNISLSGDVSLTPKWKITGSTAYDINNAKISTTRIGITRDLHCWIASFSYTLMPAFTGGATDAFIATIGIKSPSLKDLKYDRRSQPF